jgi:hypothetical protein
MARGGERNCSGSRRKAKLPPSLPRPEWLQLVELEQRNQRAWEPLRQAFERGKRLMSLVPPLAQIRPEQQRLVDEVRRSEPLMRMAAEAVRIGNMMRAHDESMRSSAIEDLGSQIRKYKARDLRAGEGLGDLGDAGEYGPITKSALARIAQNEKDTAELKRQREADRAELRNIVERMAHQVVATSPPTPQPWSGTREDWLFKVGFPEHPRQPGEPIYLNQCHQ